MRISDWSSDVCSSDLLKKEGDAVSSGDVLAEIETDKATMEVEAVDEGVLGKILVPEGTDAVPVNQVIAVLLEDGEDARSEEHTSELQSLMRISYAVFCLKKKTNTHLNRVQDHTVEQRK